MTDQTGSWTGYSVVIHIIGTWRSGRSYSPVHVALLPTDREIVVRQKLEV